MRQRNVKNCDEILQNSDKYVKDINELKEGKKVYLWIRECFM